MIKLPKSKINPYLGFQDKYFMIIGIPAIGILIPFFFFGKEYIATREFFLTQWLVASCYSLVYWVACRYVFIEVRKRFPTIKTIKKRQLITGALVLAAYFSIDALMKPFVDNVLCPNQELPPHSVFFGPSLMIIALVSSIYESIYLYYQLRISIEEKELLQRENIQSQLESLRNQVNPHFLFNSLNTLVYLIPEDQNRAVTFVKKLSKTYRYILEIKDKKLVTLAEEFDFLQAYNFLLKERFGMNFQLNWTVPDYLADRKIISLSLQLLIENAIKHNIISTQRPLIVDVFVEGDNTLVVQNTLQKRRQVSGSTGTGLENIKNRYRFYSDEEVKVIVTTQHFIVALPLINAGKTKDYSAVKT